MLRGENAADALTKALPNLQTLTNSSWVMRLSGNIPLAALAAWPKIEFTPALVNSILPVFGTPTAEVHPGV
jgi:hypothetical protein